MSYEKKAIEQYRNEVNAIKKMIEEGEWNYAKKKCSELIKKMDVILGESDKEICNECGKSVAFRSGLFVNRIVSLNDFATRKEMGKPFPDGGYICRECWKEDVTRKVGEQ